jgi:Arc/MetJ-type ribon-helix-helix transcriptional regulator
MDPAADSKSCQLRVRVTAEERDLLEKLCTERGRGVTISDLVREAISLLLKSGGEASRLNPAVQRRVEGLAILLKREPTQVEEACIEGIIDLIESKCEVPLIVMETHLHLKYRNGDEKQDFPWSGDGESPQKKD